MERKIGEIFEIDGEWYQCIIGHCNQCSFDEAGTCKFIGNPYCAYRNDKKLACFKKLEKVGEPYRRWLSPFNNIMVQRYRLYGRNVIMPDEPIMLLEPNYKNSVEIEIKQNKEDMKEKKLNLKTFDLEAAKSGKPVCTRDGRKARIICYDRQSDHGFPLVVLVENTGAEKDEDVHFYRANGTAATAERAQDLMMATEHHVGYINVHTQPGSKCYWTGNVFDTKEDAYENISTTSAAVVVATVKIEWEE